VNSSNSHSEPRIKLKIGNFINDEISLARCAEREIDHLLDDCITGTRLGMVA
jgi:hypothetical protein